MKKLCVIGDPVAHSKSPLIHNTMLRALGLSYVYGLRHVPCGETVAWLKQAAVEDYAGFNATMPHKESLASLADVLDEDAAMYGSVNTVCMEEGKICGYNTDGRGFAQALADEGIFTQGRRVMLLGAGGAAKAVALKLARQGVERVYVCNRTPEKAQALCEHNRQVLTPAGFEPDTLKRLAKESHLLVNCTSLGMEGTAGQFEDFSFLEALPEGGAVCDLIYAPRETMLLAQARCLGRSTMNGLGMLIWQAIFALEHFTHTRIDGAAMAGLLKETLQADEQSVIK
jgi:shikimate dehydrogenase